MEIIRRNRKLLLPLLILALLVTPLLNAVAQTEAESSRGLQIINQYNEKRSKIVPEGGKIKIVTDSGERIKGTLGQVSEDRFVVDGRVIRLDEVSKVRARVMRVNGAKVGGVISLVIGLVMGILGAVLAVLGFRTESDGTLSGCAALLLAILLVILGIALGIVGGALITVGLISLLIGLSIGRLFRMGKKWRLERGDLSNLLKG